LILVPIKDFAGAKQRLAGVLTPGQRARLARVMFADVLTALLQVKGRAQIGVVTRDKEAIAIAEEIFHHQGTVARRLQIIHDRENAGETEAIAAATQEATARGARFTLVIPGDAPLITTQEISEILRAVPDQGAVLVPAADGQGTNAVLRRPGDLFQLRFGNHSFAPHLRAAEATGKPVAVLRLRGVALDIDRPDDLEELVRRPGRTKAQELVRSWQSGQWSVASGQ